MSRSLAVKAVAGVVTMAGIAVFEPLAVSSYHEEDEPPQAGAAKEARGQDRAWDRPIAMPPGLVGLHITLGLEDSEPTDWEGTIAVSEGRILDIEVERGGPEAQATGARFSVRSKTAAEKKKPQTEKQKKKQAAKQKKKQQAKKQQQAGLVPALRVLLDAPPTATVTVKAEQGSFDVALRDLVGRQTFLDGQVAVEKQVAAVRLTGRGTEDDFPALARAPDGSAWLAYVEYQPERPRLAEPPAPEEFDRVLVPTTNGDRIRLARFDGAAWQPPLDVTDARLDVWRPAVAVDGTGSVCVAWAQQVDGNWDIYRRSYTPAAGLARARWSEVVRVTDAPGSDFHVVAATDAKGVVWLAWQAFREGNFDILVAAAVDDRSMRIRPRPLTRSRADDWSPAIATDSKGNVYVAWDTYDRGNYDVSLVQFGGAKPWTWDVARSPRFEARPSLACDAQGRVWIAYEEGDEQWGKDYSTGEFRKVGFEKNPGFALYINRTVRVKCLEDGVLKQTAGDLETAFAPLGNRNRSLPRLAVDASGGPWLLLRHHPLPGGAGEAWISSHLRYDGEAWSELRPLPRSSNLLDNRPALAALDDGILAVYSSDTRTNTQGRDQDDLFAAILRIPRLAGPPHLVADAPAPAAQLEPVHADEPADIARMRAYRVEAGGKSLRLLRGEFHRHTEYTSHRDGDGLLEDSWRYALDAADHDWMGNGDHMNGFGHEYLWWTIQKTADLFHNAPRFVAAQTYERSAVYPNGHRNVMFPRRGIRPLPFGVLAGTPEAGSPDTKVLYAYLRHFGGICASHTSATNMGTDWRDNDPDVEPVVEIYQGHRHNYEHLGAPRAPTEETNIGGYQPAGFVWNALAKGYRLGFQSSSDHISTHWSYAVVLADDPSRRGIIDAFRQRHCYAATDNIILDVRSGAHLMGDAFETSARPSLEVVVEGTSPISRVHVIRDNAYAFSTEPNRRTVKLTYTDDDADLKPGTHYYYVRVQQADGNLAWASPMWVTFTPTPN